MRRLGASACSIICKSCSAELGVGIEIEAGSKIGNCALAPNAVAGLVERRWEGADPRLSRRDRDQAAADAALGRKTRAIEPLPAVVVHSSRCHQRNHARDVAGIYHLLAGEQIAAAERKGRAHYRKIAS